MKPYEQYFQILTTAREKLIHKENNFHRLLGICFNQYPDDPKQRDVVMNRLIQEEARNLESTLESSIESLTKINFN